MDIDLGDGTNRHSIQFRQLPSGHRNYSYFWHPFANHRACSPRKATRLHFHPKASGHRHSRVQYTEETPHSHHSSFVSLQMPLSLCVNTTICMSPSGFLWVWVKPTLILFHDAWMSNLNISTIIQMLQVWKMDVYPVDALLIKHIE